MKVKWSVPIFFLLFFAIVPVIFAEDPLRLYVNGQPVTSIGSEIVKLIDNRLYVDIHAISSELKVNVESDTENNAVYISTIDEPQSEVVATLKKANATLYATRREGQLEKFRLEINGGVKHFPYWRSSGFPAFGPRFFYEDINHDGSEELVIVLTTGHGTGTIITEAHVLQKTKTNIGELFQEKLIDNPVAILYKNVKTRKLSDDRVEITVGEKKTIEKITPYLAGEIVDFSVLNNELVVFMSGQLSPLPEGGILITYEFKDNMYQAKKIEYVKHRPDFSMESSFQ